MLRYIYGHDLQNHPKLARSMFQDRADQFRTRLGWDVNVNHLGEERDQYDDLDPLYVIWQNQDGGHGGSMRFLPTTGRVMVNEIFGHLTGVAPISSPLIWECTRFCLSRGAEPTVAAALMLGGGKSCLISASAISWVCSTRAWCASIAQSDPRPRFWAAKAKGATVSASACGSSRPRPATAWPHVQGFRTSCRACGSIGPLARWRNRKWRFLPETRPHSLAVDCARL